ncbi:MAG: SDR family oxidoreductase [Parachlamydia sp.]|nr:SDR family oxidoreductase [Parachlamydia sp.]
MAKILVTGATGFIGKRLISALLTQGHEVYALVRIRGQELFPYFVEGLHLIFGDMQNRVTLAGLPCDLDAAYYLMHSMSDIMGNFIDLERKVAENFLEVIKETKTKQIIYLSGIISEERLSRHLQSRLMVEEILKAAGIPFTILRASIVVGEGSASFEIIRDLVEKLPCMIAPRWVKSLCQPISVSDVLFYLEGVLLHPDCLNRTFEIGGPDVLSFKQLLLQYAEVRDLKRWIITVPVLTPRLSSYWLVFITSVRFSLAYYLVESMKVDTFCRNSEIMTILPHKCLTYKESIRLAIQKISQNEVVSTWMDSWEIRSSDPDVSRYIQVPTHGILYDEQRVELKSSIDKVLNKIWSIGGETGWPLDWAWTLRGLIDKFLGGVGTNRGRRHPSEIMVGDSIDFWRVLKADKEERHLILYAEMKLPGEAWLEFKIEENQLIQRATFRPKGLPGRLYWYAMFPFHIFIFRRMAQKLS